MLYVFWTQRLEMASTNLRARESGQEKEKLLSEKAQCSVAVCGKEVEGHPESTVERERGKLARSAQSSTHRF